MHFMIAKKSEEADILDSGKDALTKWPGVTNKAIAYSELGVLAAITDAWPNDIVVDEPTLDKWKKSWEKIFPPQGQATADLYRVSDAVVQVLAESNPAADAQLAAGWPEAWRKFNRSRAAEGLQALIADLRALCKQARDGGQCLYIFDPGSVKSAKRVKARPMETSHIWLGRFASKEALDAYFEEHLDDDDAPINAFAAGQGTDFYDDSWVETSFEPGGDLQKLVRGSYSRDYRAKVIALAEQQGITNANTFILADQNTIKKPRSVKEKDHELWYLGTFECIVRPTRSGR